MKKLIIVILSFYVSLTFSDDFDSLFSNGENLIKYKGMEGYFVHSSEVSLKYFNFISKVNELRYVIPYLFDEEEYHEAVIKSWGWDTIQYKDVSIEALSDYALVENVVIKPGIYILKKEISGKKWESTALRFLREISDEEAFQKYGPNWKDLLIEIPDSFLTNYKILPYLEDGSILFTFQERFSFIMKDGELEFGYSTYNTYAKVLSYEKIGTDSFKVVSYLPPNEINTKTHICLLLPYKHDKVGVVDSVTPVPETYFNGIYSDGKGVYFLNYPQSASICFVYFTAAGPQISVIPIEYHGPDEHNDYPHFFWGNQDKYRILIYNRLSPNPFSNVFEILDSANQPIGIVPQWTCTEKIFADPTIIKEGFNNKHSIEPKAFYCSGKLNLFFNETKEAELSLYNLLGRQVFNHAFCAKPGLNSLEIGIIARGPYILAIRKNGYFRKKRIIIR